MAWHRTLYAGGWLGLSWPKEYGGRGLGPLYDAIVNDEVGRAGGPTVPSVGFLGRAILHFGTPEQCERFLSPMLRGEVQWCQGFSEPGAGSDLASLTTKAELHGDNYVVCGQKVWTSRAQWSDWCLLLCRTRGDLPQHKGLSCLVFEMERPGITVRPLRQIWGSAEFNEVFFDDLVVPVNQRIGADGDGWRLATTVLAHERGPADIGFISKFERQLGDLRRMLADLAPPDRARLAPRVAQADIAVSACRLHVLKSLSLRAKGVAPGPETSVDKLLMTRAEQQLGALVSTRPVPDRCWVMTTVTVKLCTTTYGRGRPASMGARSKSNATSSLSACSTCRAPARTTRKLVLSILEFANTMSSDQPDLASKNRGTRGFVNDETLAAVRRRIGIPTRHRQRFHNESCSADSFRHFAQGYGDDNPLYCDAEYARMSPWAGLVAPPCIRSRPARIATCDGPTPRQRQ